uniref:Si:dkey-246e1.3 n=2 Tax=Lepisosteus oculatus TaxID=7918 RepID=W5N2A8_LEPOC
NGNMSGNVSTAAVILTFNRTAGLETANRVLNDAVYEFKVFNITVTSLALGILAFTGIFCSISYYTRRRQFRQARAYENTVIHEKAKSPVDFKGVKRSHSLRSPLAMMRKQDTYRDSSQIYFIYSNPIAIAEGSNVIPGEHQVTFENIVMQRDDIRDTKGGIILDPSTFYMQL